jgi:hypothetical protein
MIFFSPFCSNFTVATELCAAPSIFISGFYPSLRSKRKAVGTCLVFKGIEFDAFNIGIVYLLSQTAKLNGIPCTQPVLNDIFYSTIRNFA